MRLKSSGEFQQVRAGGISCHGRYIVLSVLKTQEAGVRFGLITSRRIGNAVKRNRVRRRFRELVRLACPQLKPGHWVVLIARKAAVEAEFKTLEREWLSLAERASILSSPC
jgi:ribonuclease P protein component